MSKRRQPWAPKQEKQLALFTREQMPRARVPTGRLPPPPPISATVTEQLPAELVAAGWRIVWRTEQYADGWFYAINEQLGQQTFDHIYVKHRGYKYAIVDITKARTTPIQEQAQ